MDERPPMVSGNNGTTSDTTSGLSIVLLIMQMVTMVLIIFGNTLTIVAISKFYFLRSVSNLFTVSLAAADLLIATVLPLSSFLRYTDLITNQKIPCWCSTIVTVASQCASLLTLLAMAIDRYIAVVYPLRYETLMTSRRAYIMIAIVWTYSILLPGLSVPITGIWPVDFCAVVNLVSPKVYQTLYTGTIIGAIVPIILVYMRIFYVARKQARSIGIQPVAGSSTNPDSDLSNVFKKRMNKMMTIVVGCFLLCWLPYSLTSSLRKTLKPTPRWLLYSNRITIALLYCNSFMNPIIYGWKNRMFRVAYKRLLGLNWQKDMDGILNQSQNGHTERY